MEKRISIKTLYLLFVISFGLIGLGVGSTYAVFTTSDEIENPITLSSNLSYESFVAEVIEVSVPSGETVSSTLNITNSSSGTLNYIAWYLNDIRNIEVGTNSSSSGAPTGNLASGGSTSVIVDIRNNSNVDKVVTVGISSGTGSVVLGSSMSTVSSDELPKPPVNLIEHITNLYTGGTPTLITQSNSNKTYYYSYQDSGQTWGLMNDGLKVDTTLDATTTGLAVEVTDTTKLTTGEEGNIRFFGPNGSVNNYIYFNCSDYSNQSSSTCERWRIIGIVDGKVKIIRNESIGDLSWDQDKNQDSALTTASNNWETSSLQLMLNSSYLNGDTAGTITYYSGSSATTTTSLNMSNIGIKNATTRGMISESVWYLGGYETAEVYSNEIYAYERKDVTGITKYSGNPFRVEKNIGLMYASDYGYGTDLSKCSDTISAYNSSTDSYACKNNNWLFYSGIRWLITPNPLSSDQAWVSNVEVIDTKYYYVSYYSYGVRPVLYLNSELIIEPEGDGSSGNPYKLVVS